MKRSDQPESPNTKPRRRRWKWIRMVLWVVAVAAVIFVLVDFGYSRFVSRNIKRWESAAVRNDEGILAGCEAYSVGKEKSGVALLLIHGINDSPHAFSKVAPYLAKQGFFCRCMRLPGFGESVDRYAKASIKDWIKGVDAEIRQLRIDHQRVVIVAHSLGGAIAVRYLLEHPDSADGLVLAAPVIDVSSARSPVFPVRFWHQLLKRLLIFTDTTQSPFEIDVLDPAEKNSKHRTPFTPLKIIDQTFELVAGNRQRAKELRLPLLFCLAEQDKVIDNAAAKEFYKQAASKKKRLIMLDHSAHAILVDYQWQKFCDEVVSFLMHEVSSAK